MSSQAIAAESVVAEAMEERAEATDTQHDDAQAAEAQAAEAQAAEAHDDAVLDMVAMEMAAPDPEDIYDPPESETDDAPTSYETEVSSEPQIPYEPQATALPPVALLDVVAERPEPVTAAAVQPAQEPEPSLGSSLIASGLVRGHAASRPDPLAAIRRMSQAEKIALFS